MHFTQVEWWDESWGEKSKGAYGKCPSIWTGVGGAGQVLECWEKEGVDTKF